MIKEIHSIANGKDSVDEVKIDMTDLQFEQVFKLLDKDDNGKLKPAEIVDLIVAYETWLYEKQYKNAMEDLYADSNKDNLVGEENGFWSRALRLLSSPQYELAMNIITIINIFTVFYYAL